MAKQKFVSFANLFSVSKALRERAKAEAANVQSAYDVPPGVRRQIIPDILAFELTEALAHLLC